MNYNLIVEVTGAEEIAIPYSTKQEYPIRLNICDLDMAVHVSDTYGMSEYQISFVPQKEVRLKSVKVQLPIAQNGLGANYPLYFFDNGVTTNTFAKICQLMEDDKEVTRTRDLVTMHNLQGNLNAAFTTFERFYTEFYTNSEGITVVYYMENKLVHPGEEYILETLVLDDQLDGLEFFEQYTQLLHDRYHIKPMRSIPAGWSSWSCVYRTVTEKIVAKQAELLAKNWRDLGADLIQIDDGWQKGDSSFDAYWTADKRPEKFSHDIPWLAKMCKDLGLRFGLWMAPGMLTDTSERFEELKPYLNWEDGKLIRYFGAEQTIEAERNGTVFGMDLGKEEVLEMVREMFHRGIEEYGAEYFKVDFIVYLLVKTGNNLIPVQYDSGYSVELYKRFVKEIRKTVGDEIFLLACGAPIGESIGIFDAMRISNDITWGGADQASHPGPWNILRGDAQCAILRSPYHNKVFINDPDAVLVRDYLAEGENDGFTLTLEEAKMWATVASMTGGHLLVNEEIDRLSQEQKDIITNILPPLGLAARPRDFYEYPWCSEAFIEADQDTQLCAVYNWGEDEITKTVKNPFDGTAVLVDSWSHQIIGCLEPSKSQSAEEMQNVVNFTLPAHTSRAFLMKRLPEDGGFLYNDGDFYLGIGRTMGRPQRGQDYYYFPVEVPQGYTAVENDMLRHLYVK